MELTKTEIIFCAWGDTLVMVWGLFIALPSTCNICGTIIVSFQHNGVSKNYSLTEF